MLVTTVDNKIHSIRSEKSGSVFTVKEKVWMDVTFYRTYEEAMALVKPEDKVAFLIRHSEKDGNGDAHLSQNGEAYATDAGSRISSALPASFFSNVKYYSTDTNRTKETAVCISAGIDPNSPITTSDVDLSMADDQLRSDYFLRGSNVYGHNVDWVMLSKYAYNIVDGPDALSATVLAEVFGTTAQNNSYYANSLTSEIVNAVLRKMTGKLTFFITHDNMLAPFIITVTGTGINMRQYESSTEEWVDYVSGVIFIKHVDNTFDVLPVKA